MALDFFAGQELAADDLDRLVDLTAYRTASATSRPSSTTYVDDDVLTLAVKANRTYFGQLEILYAATTTADFKIRLTVPSGASTPNWTYVDATPAADNWIPTTGLTVPGQGAATISGFRAGGMVIMGANDGFVTVQWAQNSSEASNCQTISGCVFTLKEV